MTQSLSLYEIEHELLELLRMRDNATEEGAPPAELEAIEQALSDYFTREVRKVNGIAEAIHSYEAAAAQALSEAKRMKERAESLDNTAKRIKAATLRAMQDHRVRILETAEHRLRVQANGGKEPLEIDRERDLPDHLSSISVIMPVNCPRCKGDGTVPATIPGARLLPRGYHLRVE